MSALKQQVAGNHYRDLKIQPAEFCEANDLNYCQSQIIRYVVRYKNKNKKQDLQKAKHMIDVLMHIEGYANDDISS